LDALPLLDGDAGLRRRAFDGCDVLARGEDLAAMLANRCLRLRRVLLLVGIGVLHLDLAYKKDRRLCLRVQLVERDRAEAEAGERGKYCVASFHGDLPFGVPP